MSCRTRICTRVSTRVRTNMRTNMRTRIRTRIRTNIPGLHPGLMAFGLLRSRPFGTLPYGHPARVICPNVPPEPLARTSRAMAFGLPGNRP